jgi:hypothetical protein
MRPLPRLRPIRSRWRGARRSLRTFSPGPASLFAHYPSVSIPSRRADPAPFDSNPTPFDRRLSPFKPARPGAVAAHGAARLAASAATAATPLTILTRAFDAACASCTAATCPPTAHSLAGLALGLGASHLTLVPIRPRRRGERRSLRTFAVVSLRPGSLAHNPDAPRRLSTPLLTPFNSTPTFARMDPRPF